MINFSHRDLCCRYTPFEALRLTRKFHYTLPYTLPSNAPCFGVSSAIWNLRKANTGPIRTAIDASPGRCLWKPIVRGSCGPSGAAMKTMGR
eukprot:scaffold272518_cov30-Tisochrysis_lutea.AAC.7